MIVLVPLGLLAPGTAWGEWGTEQLSSLGLAFIPQGMAKLSGLWSAPLPGYDLPALKNANLGLHPFGNCWNDCDRNRSLVIHDAGYCA